MTGETIVTDPWWERYRADLASRESHRIELFVRSLSPVPGTHRQRTELVRRLDDLDAAGLIDGYDVTVLGEELCLCETCREIAPGTYLRERLRELQEWGGDRASPLAFTEREVNCSLTGEVYRVLVPPTTSLAAYVDGSLTAVFPCRIDGETYDVTDFVEALTRTEAKPDPTRADA